MKILILGARGYVGKRVSIELNKLGRVQVLDITRDEIDFDRPHAGMRLAECLEFHKPRVVINAIGTIDSLVQGDSDKLINSILKPTFYIFEFYRRNLIHSCVDVITIGSTASGQPRALYPFYSCLKHAERALADSAREIFADYSVKWDVITVPRLNGGLGAIDREASLNSDAGLDALVDEIVDRIRELPIET